ncbi:hypothetical protein [Aquabacterium sp.]|uniref:hypothetical protein n=1 Tax=Aquabacterium sp. TaxID=1872578 RepID=UPI0035B07C2D
MQISKFNLVMGALVLALIATAIGVLIGLSVFSNPMEKWQAQFTETYVPAQAEALQGLNQGQPDKARQYLQKAAAVSLATMGQQRSEGTGAALSPKMRDAVQYLCDNLPEQASRAPSSKVSVGEACVLLLVKR